MDWTNTYNIYNIYIYRVHNIYNIYIYIYNVLYIYTPHIKLFIYIYPYMLCLCICIYTHLPTVLQAFLELWVTQDDLVIHRFPHHGRHGPIRFANCQHIQQVYIYIYSVHISYIIHIYIYIMCVLMHLLTDYHIYIKCIVFSDDQVTNTYKNPKRSTGLGVPDELLEEPWPSRCDSSHSPAISTGSRTCRKSTAYISGERMLRIQENKNLLVIGLSFDKYELNF